jgi:hypothetical protein
MLVLASSSVHPIARHFENWLCHSNRTEPSLRSPSVFDTERNFDCGVFWSLSSCHGSFERVDRRLAAIRIQVRSKLTHNDSCTKANPSSGLSSHFTPAILCQLTYFHSHGPGTGRTSCCLGVVMDAPTRLSRLGAATGECLPRKRLFDARVVQLIAE